MRYRLYAYIVLDEEDRFSVKHVAASRFHRNQKLMADIFSDTVVPDLRTSMCPTIYSMSYGLIRLVSLIESHYYVLLVKFQEIFFIS